MEPRVSIVIPCFNEQECIGDAIESALAQTDTDREIVVIDDGSTDASLDVIRSFGDRVRWETGPHRGGSASRNRGTALARGRLIQFLDADDVLFPQKLARQVPVVLERVDAVVFCDRVERRSGDAEGLAISRPMNGRDAVVYVLSETLQTSAPIHWRTLLMKVGGFREELPCAQEFDLHLRLAASGVEFVHMPESLYELRKRERSVSSSYEHVLDQYATIVTPVIEQLCRAGALTETRRIAFARLMGNAGRLFLTLGSREKAERAFAVARGIHAEGWLTVYSPPARLLRRIVGGRCLEWLESLKRERHWGGTSGRRRLERA